MTTPTPEQREAVRHRPASFSVGHQRWSNLLFAHWEAVPAEVQATLPPGLFCDTYEGKAYVGIVPFFMERIRPALLPPLPWLSWFLELNVRTYVYDEKGRPGVWFYSLDCNQPIAVKIARRLFHLPYFNARMTARRIGGVIDYYCQRHGSREARYRWATDGDTRLAIPGSLEFFLLERYALFTAKANGGIYTGRVYHEPYRYLATKAEVISTEPASRAGFAFKNDPCSLLTVKSVDVEIFKLEKVLT